MIEALIGEPDPTPLFPYGAVIAATVTEEKALDVLTRLTHVLRRYLASANEIPHRFVRLVRNPDRCEFAGAGHARQHYCVASVGFHVIAGALRCVGR